MNLNDNTDLKAFMKEQFLEIAKELLKTDRVNVFPLFVSYEYARTDASEWSVGTNHSIGKRFVDDDTEEVFFFNQIKWETGNFMDSFGDDVWTYPRISTLLGGVIQKDISGSPENALTVRAYSLENIICDQLIISVHTTNTNQPFRTMNSPHKLQLIGWVARPY